MPHVDIRQTAKFRQGRTGERAVADWLQQRGWYVVPSYDYSGEDGTKAPRLQGARDGFVVPDLDVSKNGKRLWAEVKTKTAATYTLVMRRHEHGIPLRHYRAYQRVQRITGCDVWLFIVEQQAQTLLAGSIDRLDAHKRIYQGRRMDHGGMVFFPRDAFLLKRPLSSIFGVKS